MPPIAAIPKNKALDIARAPMGLWKYFRLCSCQAGSSGKTQRRRQPYMLSFVVPPLGGIFLAGFTLKAGLQATAALRALFLHRLQNPLSGFGSQNSLSKRGIGINL